MGDRTEGIANFKISVDGKPVKSESRWRVIHDLGGKGEEDITAKLLQTGWTIPQLRHVLNREGKASIEEGYKEGKQQLPSEWFDDGYLNIAVQQYFIWQQRFPAGKEIVIHHSYTPSTSTGVPDSLDSLLGDELGDQCLTAATRKALKQLDAGIKYKNEDGSANIGWGYLGYILKTGANWKEGVIGDFTLRIHKKDETEVVVPCFNYPLKQIDPLTLEFKQKTSSPMKTWISIFITILRCKNWPGNPGQSLLHRSLENHAVRFLSVLRELVEVQVTVSIHRRLIYLRHKGLVLFRRRQFADKRCHRRQLRRSQEDVRTGT
ncbi:hypothetical protein SEEH3547_19989 [Salmonella enterica subsp. enterica serovar Heidelberg str. 75-3547]|nr:hypothetical protein SEEH3547_19989 [Salmonella enterica subsp. enterica serovar Heidelberg str. 75-3547]